MVVPGGVALSIVGERERLTLPLLQVSQLSAGQVVRGKLMSSMSYVMLLLVAVAPIVALPSLFGGVSLREAAAGLGWSCSLRSLGCISLWISARARSTRRRGGGMRAGRADRLPQPRRDGGGDHRLPGPPRKTFFPVGGQDLLVLDQPYIGMVSAVGSRSRGTR